MREERDIRITDHHRLQHRAVALLAFSLSASTVSFATFTSTSWAATNSGAGGAAAALARAVSHYERTVTSPMLHVDGRLTDVAALEQSVATTATIAILEYHAPTWRIDQRIVLPPYSLGLAFGHLSATSSSPSAWFQVFDLGATRPAFALYDTGASGWGGLVIGKLSTLWEIVPFQGSGTKVIDYPEFRSPQDVTTARNNCVPNCAEGKWSWRLFRFSPTRAKFVQIGPVRTSRPSLPYPKPNTGTGQ